MLSKERELKNSLLSAARLVVVMVAAVASYQVQGADCTSLGACCDAAGCDGACDACCNDACCKKSTLYFGVEATYLAPIYDNGNTSFSLIDPVPPAGITFGSSVGKADELTGAPRLTLGWVGKRDIGIQARYWALNNVESSYDTPAAIVGNQGQALGGADEFDAYTFDLELTKQGCKRGWDLMGTFGIRYAEYEASKASSAYGAVNGDVFNLGTFQSVGFHGTGMTFSLNGIRQLKKHPSVSMYLNGRGSVLFGDAETIAIASSAFSGAAGNGSAVFGAIDDSDETMFIGEIGAGLQWSRCVGSYNSRFFARGGVEYQYWGTSSGNALAVAQSGTVGNSFGQAVATGGSQNLDLIGFSLMTGFYW